MTAIDELYHRRDSTCRQPPGRVIRACWRSPTRRAASARPRRRSISARRWPPIGERVLIVDLDPQGNASTGLGIDRAIAQHLDL